MTSLLIHAVLGVLTVVLFFKFNAHLYRPGWNGARISALEAVYWLFALVSVACGWYFNIEYMKAFGAEGGWWHFTLQLFNNPASGSISQDLIIVNVVLFPLWTMIDGPRRGLKQCWLYFVMSLVTSFAFAVALYLVAVERQLRWQKAQG